MVVMCSSVPGRVLRFLPAWRKCMTMTIRLTRTIGFEDTNTIGYYRGRTMFCRSPSVIPAHTPGAYGTSRATHLRVSLVVYSASYFADAAAAAERAGVALHRQHPASNAKAGRCTPAPRDDVLAGR